MELLNDLFVTASLALLLSFVVAKLFSRATVTPPAHRDSDEPISVEDVRSGQQLRVQVTRTQRKAEFIVREPLEKVEEFSPIQVESHLEIERSRGEIAVESDTVGKDDEFQDGRLLDIQHQHEEIAVDPDVVEKIEEIQGEGHLEIGNGRGEIMVDSDVINPPTISPEEKFSEDIASEVSNAVQSMDGSLREKIAQVDVDGKIGEFDCEANLDGSAEQRNKERVEEISEVSTIEAGIPAQSDEIMVLKNDEEERDEEKEVAVDFEDDWEGVERSELEKVFMAATEFVVGSDSVASIGSDVQMDLYGLHKVATEGPCREPQPMPLKLSARAKWNAWQKLGNMNPEVAMEQYVTILSDKVPGWVQGDPAGKSEQEAARSEFFGSADTDLGISLSHQQNITIQRTFEQESGAHDSLLIESDLESRVTK